MHGKSDERDECPYREAVFREIKYIEFVFICSMGIEATIIYHSLLTILD